jgi:hypothetical protein
VNSVRIVEVVLSDGRDHAFPNGRDWIENDDGSLTIIGDNQELLAKVAGGRWLVIGWREFVAESARQELPGDA